MMSLGNREDARKEEAKPGNRAVCVNAPEAELIPRKRKGFRMSVSIKKEVFPL